MRGLCFLVIVAAAQLARASAAQNETALPPATLLNTSFSNATLASAVEAVTNAVKTVVDTSRPLTFASTAPITATLVNGVLTIQGTPGNDHIVVNAMGGVLIIPGTQYTVTNPTQAGALPVASVTKYQVYGLDGNDFIQLPNITLPSGGATVDGGNGVDTLVAPAATVRANVDRFMPWTTYSAMLPSAKASWDLEYRFRDGYGFVVAYESGRPEFLGEGTYFTAVAVATLAAESYSTTDSTRLAEINAQLLSLLTVLDTKAWATGTNGRYPIRHPTLFEYEQTTAGCKAVRNQPLARDGVGQIILGSYYAFKSPRTSAAVKTAAKTLISHWVSYVQTNQWKLREFTTTKAYIDAACQNEVKSQPEAYMLFPLDGYALRNVASSMGMSTSGWNIWANAAFTLVQSSADVVADVAARGLDKFLSLCVGDIPFKFGGKSLRLTAFKGKYLVPAQTQAKVVSTFKAALVKAVQSLQRPWTTNPIDLALDAIAQVLPNDIPFVKWRPMLQRAFRLNFPYLMNADALEEAMTVVASLQIIKRSLGDSGSSIVGYSAWFFALELEAHPEFNDLLQLPVTDTYNVLKASGNPNGLWAWLARDAGTVQQQLALFESKPQRWWYDYAWQREAVPFFKRTEMTDSPTWEGSRIDYLALRALSKKGFIAGISAASNDWLTDFQSALTGLADYLASACDYLLSVKDWKVLGQFLAYYGMQADYLAQQLGFMGLGWPNIAYTLWNGGALGGKTVVDLGRALLAGGATATNIVSAMRSSSLLNFDWPQVANTLVNSGAVYKQGYLQVAKEMKIAGATALDMARSLRPGSLVNWDWAYVAESVWKSQVLALAKKPWVDLGTALNTAGADAQTIARALGPRTPLNFDLGSIADTLWNSGAMAGQKLVNLGGVLLSIGGNADSIAIALRPGSLLNRSWGSIADALWNCGAMAGATTIRLGSVLNGAGASATSVAIALGPGSLLNWGWGTVANTLWKCGSMAQKTIAQMSGVLRSVGATAEDIAYALRPGGLLNFSWASVGHALWNSVSGLSSVDLAAVLNSAGASYVDIRDAFSVSNLLNFSYETTANAVWNSGAMDGKTATDLVRLLYDRVGFDRMVNILRSVVNMGYWAAVGLVKQIFG